MSTRLASLPARAATAAGLGICLLSTGCLSPLSKHAAALSAATAPVVDQAAAAFQSANAVHDLRLDYEAVAKFDAVSPVYNPRTIQPLLSERDIAVRLSVLAAFQMYVKSVVAITNGTDSPELQAAAKATGQSLTGLGNTLVPIVASQLGIAAADPSTTQTVTTNVSGGMTTSTSSTTSAAAPALTPSVSNGITVAVDALGQFLIYRKTKKELPAILKTMDETIRTLCGLLQADLSLLEDQEGRDYNFMIDQQTLFIRVSSDKLEAEERRAQIMKLPQIVRQSRVSIEQLTELDAAIVRLELTHHALAAEAQGNNPESLKGKLGELEAAGSQLGGFYSSLPKN